MIRKSAIWLSRLLWTVAVTILVTVALYASLGRYYIDYVESYQSDVVAGIVDNTGLALTVGRLYGHWSRLSPVFTLDNVALYAPGSSDKVLTATEVSFQVDPLSSLLNQTLRIKKLSVNGIKCSLQETEPGRWQIQGYPVEARVLDLDTLIDLVLSVGRVELVNADMDMRFHSGDEAGVAINELSLRRAADFRRLRLSARVDESERPLLMIVESTGDPRDTENFTASAYLKLDDLDLSEHMPAMRVLGIELQKATINSELWIDWKPGTEVLAQGKISTPYLDIAGLSGETLEPLEDLQVEFHLEKSVDHFWKIWVPAFETRWQGENLLIEQMALEASAGGINVALPYLSVDQTVKNLLAVNLLAEPEQQLIETLSPQGGLQNIHVELLTPEVTEEGVAPAAPRFSIRAWLDNVSIEAWHGAPGGKGISGYFEARPLQGVVELDAPEMELSFPVVYHHSLVFDHVRGKVRWTLDDERVIVRSGPLRVDGFLGPATASLGLDLPLHPDEGTPLMDLAIGIRDTDAQYRDLLLPYTLPPHLLEWLEHSIPSGTVVEGGFIYRGSLRAEDYPERTVQLFFDVKDTSLDFHSDWPPLYDIDGLVLIDDGAVDVKTERAAMYSLNIDAAEVTVAPTDKGMWLKVNASAAGSAGGVLDIVNNSMINGLVDGAFKTWSLYGDTKVAIELSVPLSKEHAVEKIDVNVDLANGELLIPDHRVDFEDIHGAIKYNHNKGLSARRLDATLKGRPLQATISQQEGAVSVDVIGKVAMADLAEWSGQPVMTFVEGETNFAANILIAPKAEKEESAASKSQMVVSSLLKGVAIDLPEPFGKSADAPREFWLRQPLNSGQNQLQMGLKGLAELQLQFDRNQLRSGLLIIGDTDKKQHYPGKFVLKGKLDTVELDQWRPVLDRYVSAQEALPENSQMHSPPLVFAASDFRVNRFELFSQQFDDNTFDIQQREDGWWVSVVNAAATGELFFPSQKDQPMSLLLDSLRIPSTGLASQGGDASQSHNPLENLEVFDGYIAINNLSIGFDDYGSLSFELLTEPGKIQLKNLGGYIRDMRIGIDKPATLTWQVGPNGEQTTVEGDADFTNLGQVLKKWNYEQFIESEYGKAEFALSWPGSPPAFNLADSNGSMSVELEKGRFLNASNAASGTLKVVGIVNLMNIVRRLRLDFSDVFNKGVSYDRVSGKAKVADHTLSIADVLEVKSPSSRFHLRGSADLKKAELDMELVATLPVASNLPWIAALAGGLPVAAGVYVASKIFEDQVDRFSSAVYTVKGDWNEPTMKFKRVFDNKKQGKGE